MPGRKTLLVVNLTQLWKPLCKCTRDLPGILLEQGLEWGSERFFDNHHFRKHIFFILYLGFNIYLNYTTMYLSKASMIVNACRHIMPVGTIQKPCFIDHFWVPHNLLFLDQTETFWFSYVDSNTCKTLKISYCISNLKQHVDYLCGMIIMTSAGIDCDQAGPFPSLLCVCGAVYVYVYIVCVRICTRAQDCVCVHCLINFCISTSLLSPMC